MNLFTVHFYRSLGEDTEATNGRLPKLIAPGNRAAFVNQLANEIDEASSYKVGDKRSPFRSVKLAFHRMARDGDTYGIKAQIETPVSKSRLVRALQGLYDRGMAGEFRVVPS